VARCGEGRAGAYDQRKEIETCDRSDSRRELLAIVIILLCAAIMARGGWV
jgi:hypothetical protein